MGRLRKLLRQNLPKYRKAYGWTQETLADRAGLSWSFIAQIETENSWVSDETLERIAAAFGFEAENLFMPDGYVPVITIPDAIRVIAAAHEMEAKPAKKPRKKPNTPPAV